MPYKIEKVYGGYKVADASRYFSNKPLTKKGAIAQRIAIVLSEHKKTGRSLKSLFA